MSLHPGIRPPGLLRLTPRGRAGLRIPHSSLYSSTRSFHASRPSQSAFLEAACNGTYQAISTLHSVSGLSWAYTIPITAVLVRVTFILPLSIFSQRNRRKTAIAHPLVSAWRPIFQKEILKEHASEGPRRCHRLLVKEMEKKRKELYKTFGLKRWPQFVGLIQLPVWLLVIETIRKMCGAKEGLLGLIENAVIEPDAKAEELGRIRDQAIGKGGDVGGVLGEGTGEVMGSSGMIRLTDATGTAVAATGNSTTSTIGEVGSQILETSTSMTSQVPVVASMATEGILWFPNLLVPDPQMYLPWVLMSSIMANLQLAKMHAGMDGADLTRFRTAVHRTLMMLSVAIAFVTVELPAAILIYWCSSSGGAIVQSLLLRRFMPMPKLAKPCRPKQKSYLGL